MARPRIDPQIRYKDVICFWIIAADATTEPRVRITCDTEGKAISLSHRLNMCRAALRGDSPAHEWDRMIVRRTGTEIIIITRPAVEWGNITLGDGTPIPAELRAHAEQKAAATDLHQHQLTTAEVKRLIQRTPFHELDPNKPLLDE